MAGTERSASSRGESLGRGGRMLVLLFPSSHAVGLLLLGPGTTSKSRPRFKSALDQVAQGSRSRSFSSSAEQATFHRGWDEAETVVADAYEGVFLPRGSFYRFESSS